MTNINDISDFVGRISKSIDSPSDPDDLDRLRLEVENSILKLILLLSTGAYQKFYSIEMGFSQPILNEIDDALDWLFWQSIRPSQNFNKLFEFWVEFQVSDEVSFCVAMQINMFVASDRVRRKINTQTEFKSPDFIEYREKMNSLFIYHNADIFSDSWFMESE